MPKKKAPQQYDLVLDKGGKQTSTRSLVQSRGPKTSWYYFGIVGQIGFSIALPIAGGAIAGSFIDQYYQTYPRWTLALLMLGVVLSFVTFYQVIKTLLDT